MKRKVIVLIGCIMVALAIALIASNDGLEGLLFQMTGLDSTEYAPGYTSTKFRRIRKDMTTNEVMRVIGGPFERFGMREAPSYDDGWKYRDVAPTAEGWDYSRSRSSSHFRKRIVVIRAGKVIDVVSKVYID